MADVCRQLGRERDGSSCGAELPKLVFCEAHATWLDEAPAANFPKLALSILLVVERGN